MKFKKILGAFGIILFVVSIVNMIAIWFFWDLLSDMGMTLKKCRSFSFDQYLAFQSTQYSILQIYFVVISVVFTMLALFGFSQIQYAARLAATKKAGEVMKKQYLPLIQEFLDKNSDKKNMGDPSYNSYQQGVGEKISEGIKE
jgi:hypothetical protein